MRFRLQTLIDITETGARRSDDDKIAYKQEANFQTVLQTVGLRVNLSYDHSPHVQELAVSKLGFADKYKGKQQVWTFDFEVEHESALDINTLYDDFDLIPVVTGLTETAKLEQALFRTTPELRNIVFSIAD